MNGPLFSLHCANKLLKSLTNLTNQKPDNIPRSTEKTYMLAGYANMPAVASPCSETGRKMSKVLEGIRVLDFGRYIAGPFCATLLGDMGAEVIRIEKVKGSEDRYLSPINENGDGAMFMQMGRNKKSVTLNPMKPEGREIVKKLVATADVVVANLPPDTLKTMGPGLRKSH
ncbi:MAG: hypothetical protein CM1200mP40_33580 [Gammaproteobacteria bacterium]|nr:MAG: hypothetical protein CM1200mP40_33580 [Gammaproteobacteria bacterium]